MQKQAKETDINRLVKNANYNELYRDLCTKYDVFTEHAVRGNLIVWDLPGDGWTSLDKADPITQSVTRNELARLQQNLPPNSIYAKCFRTPGDSYIFVKNENNNLRIKLTAWGYIAPAWTGGVDAGGHTTPPSSMQHAVLKILRNGSPAANKPFAVLRPNGGSNHFATDAQGRFDFLSLPVGTSVNLEINGNRECFVVERGKTEYVINVQEEEPPKPEPPRPEPPKTPLTTPPMGNIGGMGNISGNTTPGGNTTPTGNTGGMGNLISGNTTPGGYTPGSNTPGGYTPGGATNRTAGNIGATGNTGNTANTNPGNPGNPGNTGNPGNPDNPGNPGNPTGGTINVPLPEDNTGTWKKVLTIIGLVLLTAGTYYACSQILM